MQINEVIQNYHDEAVKAGWWNPYPHKEDRHELTMLLINSEFMEAMEGHRKSLYDDHLPKYLMFDVELADALIRCLDAGGAYGLDVPNSIVEYLRSEYRRHILVEALTVPEQLYMLSGIATNQVRGESKRQHVLRTLCAILAVAEVLKVDIWGIAGDKVAYNRERADHKPEARAGTHGKQY